MMTKRKVLLLIGLLWLWPARADAWWGWLEELSGPGPFDVTSTVIPLACFNAGESAPHLCGSGKLASANYLQLERLIELRIAYLKSVSDRPRFADVPADTNQVNGVHIEPTFMFRATPAIEVGGGAGIIAFWGDAYLPRPGERDRFKIARLTLTPLAVSFAPLAYFDVRGDNKASPWHRLLKIRFAEVLVPSFDGKDFGNSTTTFKSRPGFLKTLTVDINLGVLWDH